jgi:hypothetical protein
MYCNDCGAQNPDGSSFCSKCGSRLPAQTPAVPPQADAIPARKTDGLAVAAMVLGIASFLPPFAICSVPAIVMGAVAMNQLKKDPALEGKSMAMAGLICGSIVLFIWICLITLAIVFAVARNPTTSGVSVSTLAGRLVF